MTVWYRTAEYILVSEYYRDRFAARSGVPLMNHIREGTKLLIQWSRPEVEQRAFALHPLIQAGLVVEVRCTMSQTLMPESLPFATEYARIANKYLCRPDTDGLTMTGDHDALAEFLGPMSTSCAWMLLADKVQNQKDFRTYHWFSHDRAIQLEAYFNLWIQTLRYYYCK